MKREGSLFRGFNGGRSGSGLWLLEGNRALEVAFLTLKLDDEGVNRLGER